MYGQQWSKIFLLWFLCFLVGNWKQFFNDPEFSLIQVLVLVPWFGWVKCNKALPCFHLALHCYSVQASESASNLQNHTPTVCHNASTQISHSTHTASLFLPSLPFYFYRAIRKTRTLQIIWRAFTPV